MPTKPLVLLVQLPIPPGGMEPVRGNVPLAAGYLKLMAYRRGLLGQFDVEIFPAWLASSLGDTALVEAILRYRPCLVGFTCYLWNIERTLCLARRLKERDPSLAVLLGGPEITADNPWVLHEEAVDYAAIGEGEQTFVELLQALAAGGPMGPIAGLWTRSQAQPPPRRTLSNLDEISSPYLEGMLDGADEQLLLLETVRGCVFKCKFCYYPKSYPGLAHVSPARILANLQYAAEREVREVVLLDPTLNQRRDFAEFLALLAQANERQTFTYFGELRAEGITPSIAALLRRANFTEVEVGLQSVASEAQHLMARKNHLRAFEQGVRAMLGAGIKVKVDLIIGLPGDTPETIRQGLRYLQNEGLYSSVQVFQLAILPGTAFRNEASMLGLQYQSRPPYYVLQTPTLSLAEMYDLMDEAQSALGIEYDAPPEPRPLGPCTEWPVRGVTIDLDAQSDPLLHLPAAADRTQAFQLHLQARDFDHMRPAVLALVSRLLGEDPHATLELLFEPRSTPGISAETLDTVAAAAFASPSYLDRFYSLLPGRGRGAKRLVVLLPQAAAQCAWVNEISALADIQPLAVPGRHALQGCGTTTQAHAITHAAQA